MILISIYVVEFCESNMCLIFENLQPSKVDLPGREVYKEEEKEEEMKITSNWS